MMFPKPSREAVECAWCKVPFTPGTGRQKLYCSEKCKQRARWRRRWPSARQPAKSVTKDCLQCGTQFTRTIAESSGRTKFCSAKCWYAHRGSKKTTWKKCEECGSDFDRKGIVGRKFCSPKCQAKNRGTLLTCGLCKAEFRGCRSRKYCSRKCSTRATYPNENTPKPCLHCGEPFTRPNPYFTARAKFCSKKCQHLHQRGDKHVLYRGNRRQSRGPDWGVQSRAARKRDDNTCRSCKKKKEELGQHLSVDHFIPYRLAKVWGSRLGVNPNDLRNLFSLCRTCHGMKTQIEARLLRGDIVGFVQAIGKLGLPEAEMNEALKLFGLPEICNGRIAYGHKYPADILREHGQF